MYVREHKYSLTLSTLGVGNSCSTYLNGLLYSVRVFWDWNPAAAHSLKTFRSISTGSTQNALFRVSGTTVASSETWYEFFPRGKEQASSAASTSPPQSAMYPIEGYLHTRITSSSGFNAKVGTVVYSLV